MNPENGGDSDLKPVPAEAGGAAGDAQAPPGAPATAGEQGGGAGQSLEALEAEAIEIDADDALPAYDVDEEGQPAPWLPSIPIAPPPPPLSLAPRPQPAPPVAEAAGGAEGEAEAAPAVPAGPTAAALAEALAAEPAEARLPVYQAEAALEADPGRRALLEHELGRLLESERRDPEAARQAYARALGADPTLRPSLWALRRHGEQLGDVRGLAELVGAEATVATSAREQAELLVERGRLLEDQLGDEAAAEEAYHQALAALPSSLPALMALERRALKAGDREALAAILRASADATAEPGRRTELLVELARVEAELPGADPGLPLARLREALAIGASPGRVLDELERVAMDRGDAADLIDALEARVGLLGAGGGDDPERHALRLVELRRRQAALCRHDDPERAERYLAEGLAKAPEEPLILGDLAELAAAAGRADEADGYLARLQARLSPALATRVALQRARALRGVGREAEAAALERAQSDDPRYRALLCAERQERAVEAGDLRELAEAYREEGGLAQAAGEGRWAARALGACATLLERAGDLAGALGAWREAQACLPSDWIALDALDLALDQQGLHAERARVLEQKLAAADAQETASLLEDLVELKAGPLQDVDGAVAAGEALCAMRAGGPDGDDVAARARLVEIARMAGRWTDAADHLERLAAALEGAGAVGEAAEVELERAALLEQRLGQGEAALAAVESALRLVPEHGAAQAERRRLLRATGRWDALATSLRWEAEQSTEPAQVAALFAEAAEVYRHHLDKRDEAARTWRTLATRTADEAKARRALGQAIDLDPDPRELARWLEPPPATGSGAPGEGEAGERSAQALALAELQAERLGEPRPAISSYRRALAQADEGLAAHAALGLLSVAARAGDGAATDEALARLAVLLGTSSAAAALVEERAARAAAGGDLEGAEGLWRQALRLDPSLTLAGAGLWRLSARPGGAAPDAGRLSDALATAADSSPAGPLQAALRLRSLVLAAASGREEGAARARSLLESASAPSVSTAVVASVLAPEPESLGLRAPVAGQDRALAVERAEALLARGRLAPAGALIDGLLAVAPADPVLLELQARAARAGSDRLAEARAQHRLALAVHHPEEAAALLEEAARALDELGQVEEAAMAWRSLAAVRPGEEQAYRRATALLRQLGDDGALDQVLSAWIASFPDGPERVALLVERGQLRIRTGRPRAAAADLRAALGAVPHHTEAAEALAALHEQAGEPGEAAAYLERRFLPGAPDPGDEATAILRRLLELYHGAGHLDGARATVQRLVPRQPEDAALRSRAAEVLAALGDPAGALEQLAARVTLGGEAAALAEAELRAGEIHRDALGDREAALAAFGRALALEPLSLVALAALRSLSSTPEEQALLGRALERAAAAAQAAIAADPGRAEPFLAIERVREWQGDDDARQLATQAVAVVGGQSIPVRAALPEAARELPVELFHRAFAPPSRGPALAIWREAQEAAQRLLGVDPGSLGLGRSTRQNERGVPPAWQAVDRLARAVGAAGYVLHAIPSPPTACVVAGDQLALGPAFAGSPGPMERFLLARRLVLLRDRVGVVEVASDEQVRLFLAACARVAEVRWPGAAGLPEARIDEWARQIPKLLERKARKALVAMAPLFADLPPPERWRHELLAGADRVALAVVGDLGAAAAQLRLEGRGAEVGALARFAVSDEMGAMRRALGLGG